MSQTRADLRAGMEAPLPGIAKARFGFTRNDYEHVELEGDEIGTLFENEAHEVRLELTHVALGPWRGAFGLQSSSRDLVAIGEEAFIPGSETSDLGVFLLERAEMSGWTIETGLRFDSQDIDTDTAQSRDHEALSASLAVTPRARPSVVALGEYRSRRTRADRRRTLFRRRAYRHPIVRTG